MTTDPDAGVPDRVDDVDTSPVIAPGQILVVDDTPANLIAAEAALAPLDRTLVLASSGEEALAKLLDQDFALALLDVNMPGMDGFETAKFIRSRERTRYLPIIFLTATTHDEAAVLHAYELGAVDFLIKPVPPEVLRSKAAVFVTLHERTEQLALARMERQFEARRREYETTALKRERDRLEQNDRRKDAFIAILAHELRNPLAPIRTCVDILKQQSERPLTAKMLDILDRQSGVLARLVDDLLDVSRIKQDKIELRPERVDLVNVVEAALATSRPLIEEKVHAVVLDVPSEPVDVIVDTVRMTQVLCNLVNNAARYTPRQGRIEVACGVVEDDAFVRVRDNGIGIPLELQSTIFDMFVQERVRSDGSGGLGLGLALAKRLVEMHHGSIRAISAGRGQGSTFEVRIPLTSSRRTLAARTRTEEISAPVLASRRLRAVVVDDNQDALAMVTMILEANGVEVLAAPDGRTALALIKKHRPDVAILDLGLPDLDGCRVVETLHRDCPDLPTRFIALSGFGDAADRERTRQAGFHVHLVKPASAEALLASLR